MTKISTKALSLLLSLALIIGAIATIGTINASAESLTYVPNANEVTFYEESNRMQAVESEVGLYDVTNPKGLGADRGFQFRFTALSEKQATKVEVVLNSTETLDQVIVAFGEYRALQSIRNQPTDYNVQKSGITLTANEDKKITFDSLPVTSFYDTLYFGSAWNCTSSLSKTGTVTLKSVTVIYNRIPTYKYDFSSNINVTGNVMTFADNYWATGDWVFDQGYWRTATDRISITRKIPVKEGAVYIFTFDKNTATPNFSGVLTRVYKNGIANIADGDDLIDSNNQNTLKSNFITAVNSMEIATGSAGTSTTNIATSGTKIKIKEGSGGAYMLISLYKSGWTATDCSAALANQAADAYNLKISETFDNKTTTLLSTDGSSITTPDACSVNPGETFIGWKDESTGNLYPAGYNFKSIDSNKNFTAVSAKVETQEGAGVRWSNTDVKRGLKFTTYISGNVDAAELKNYISPALVKTVITGNEKTVDVLNSVNDGNNSFADESNTTTLVYHGSVTEYQSDTSMLTVDFTAQGVATVTYADGTTMELASSTTTTRNMAAVAQAAYDALKGETTELATAKCALLKEVYGVTD